MGQFLTEVDLQTVRMGSEIMFLKQLIVELQRQLAQNEEEKAALTRECEMLAQQIALNGEE